MTIALFSGVLTVPILLLEVSHASASTSVSWTSSSIASGESIDQISCPAANLCVGVGGGGDVFTSTNPTGGSAAWTRTFVDHAAGPFDGLTSISCPSTTLCVAVDDSGFVFTSGNPTGGAAAWSDSDVDGSTYLDAVSCPTTSLCVAVDDSGAVLSSTNPAGGAGAWASASVDSANSLDWVACASTSLCVAVDDHGNVVSSTNPIGGAAAWTLANVDGTTPLEGVTCPTTGFCTAVDDGGSVFVSSNPIGGSGSWPATRISGNALFGIGCSSPQFCVAVDDAGHAYVSFNPSGGLFAWSGSDIDGSNAIFSVECAPLQCFAGGGTGNLLSGTVIGIPQTITFASTPPTLGILGNSYTVSATGGASGNPVVITIDPNSQSNCSISGSTVKFTGTSGVCLIDANEAGNLNYAAAAAQQHVFLTAPPVISPIPKIVTRGAVVVQLTCYNGFPCSGSMRLTQLVSHVVHRGKHKVRVTTTSTLGSHALSIPASANALIRIDLNRVGQSVVADSRKHPVAVRLLYFRSGTETVIPMTLKR